MKKYFLALILLTTILIANTAIAQDQLPMDFPTDEDLVYSRTVSGIQTMSYNAWIDQRIQTGIECSSYKICEYYDSDTNICSGDKRTMTASHPNSDLLGTGYEYSTHTKRVITLYGCIEGTCQGEDTVYEKPCPLGCHIGKGTCMCEYGYMEKERIYQGKKYYDAYYCSNGDVVTDIMKHTCEKEEGIINEDCPPSSPCGPHPDYPQYVACVPSNQATAENGTYQAYLYPRYNFGNIIHASFSNGKMTTLATYTSKQILARTTGNNTFATIQKTTTTTHTPTRTTGTLVRRTTPRYRTNTYETTRAYPYDPYKNTSYNNTTNRIQSNTRTYTPTTSHSNYTSINQRTSLPKYKYTIKSTTPRIVTYKTTYTKPTTTIPYQTRNTRNRNTTTITNTFRRIA